MKYTVKDILALEVAPALGCTEPVAVALGAAAAASLLPEPGFDTLDVWVDPNVYKNGLAVSIPGTEGMQGLDTASALGALGGDPHQGLEVLSTLTGQNVADTRKALDEGKVNVHLLKDRKGLHIRTRITGHGHTAESEITGLHNNIVCLELNGDTLDDHPLISAKSESGKSELEDLETWLKGLSLDEMIELTTQLDQDDLDFLQQGIDHNMLLAEHGLKHGSGLGVGRALERLARQKMICKDMVLAAKILTSAASDARMSGVSLPAMSSAGSGNHGLTAILPIKAIADFVEVDHKTVLEAVAFSHIITALIKAYTGRLSAICGCSVAAGAGATAGVTYLLGGDAHHITGAIKNLVVDLAGVICDGAKAGCSFKLSTAAGTAVQAALFALQGIEVMSTDGIVGLSLEQTIQNVGELSTEGMIETDRTILDIMIKKKFSKE